MYWSLQRRFSCNLGDNLIQIYHWLFCSRISPCYGNNTMCLFVKKRDSPVVVTSDFKISLIHLIVISIIFMASILLEFLNPSEMTCILRVIIILSLAYTLNASFMLIKSQKLIQAFLSKLPIAAKEVRKTVSVQFFLQFF